MSLHRGIFLLLGGIVLALAWTAQYAHPTADDYCYAFRAAEEGSVWAATLREYSTWGGRYTSVATMSLFALHARLVDDYVLLCGAFLVTWLAGFGSYFRAIAPASVGPRDLAAWAGLSFITFIALLPSVAETFYWMAGGVTYTAGYAGLLLVTAWMLHITRRARSGLTLGLHGLGVTLLILTVGGAQETASFLQVAILALGALIAWREGHPRRGLWIAALAVAIGALAIVALSPGNAVRSRRFQGGGSLLILPLYGLLQGLVSLCATSALLYLITANAWVAPLTARLVAAMRATLTGLHPHSRAWIALGIPGLFAAAFMPSYYGTASYPEARTLGILPVLAVATWVPLLALLQLSGLVEAVALPRKTRSPLEPKLIAGVIIAALVLCPNVRELVRDAVRNGPRYDRELSARYAKISSAIDEGTGDVLVVALRRTPHSLFVSDIGRDPYAWRNRCMRSYYGLASIKTLSRHEPFGPPTLESLQLAACGPPRDQPLYKLCAAGVRSGDPERFRRGLGAAARAAESEGDDAD